MLDPNLREFATDRQWEILEAFDRHGTKAGAARELGITKRRIWEVIEVVKKAAARRGYAPDFEAFHNGKVPNGYILKGQSVFRGADGYMRGRWDMTRMEGQLPEEATQLPDPKKLVSLSTMSDAEGRVIVQWAKEKPEAQAQEAAWKAFAEEIAQAMPRLKPAPAPKAVSEDLLAGYPVGDHHMGMYSWHDETGQDYDLDRGEALLCGAVDYLTAAAKGAGQAVVAFLGDFMHYDSFEAVTPTSKNALDSDGRFPKMVQASVRTMRRTIDAALKAHGKVHVIVEIGNHDLSSSVFLAECLRIAYENEPRITIDTSPMHYHYFRFGKVLLGTHHGHGTNMRNLPLTMATDRPEDWGDTEHRHWWTGHIHKSKTQPATSAEDFSGCVVESFRILAPQDAWSHQKGYRSAQSMKAIVYHREHGEVARHTVNPGMLDV